MRYSISRGRSGLTVLIPRRFSLFLCLFYPLWSVGWIALAVTNPTRKPEDVIAIGAFIVGTVLVGYAWLWNAVGREELQFTQTAVVYRRVLFGISRTQLFDMAKVRTPHFEASCKRGMSGGSPSGIGFVYEGRKIRIGDNLTQKEAKSLVAEVMQALPEYSDIWSSFDEGSPELHELMTLDLKR